MLEIGVVTPTHPARGRLLTRACASVWMQTYPARGHLVVNDVDRRGAPWTRQAALELNPYPWTAFLDSDDWFMEHHLQRLAETQFETGADYVYSWYELVVLGQPRGDVQGHDGVFPRTHFTEPWDPANPRQTTITMLVRTDLAREVGFWAPDDAERFPDGHRVGEDYHFTLECNRLGKIYHLPERTWYWDHHGRNTSGRAGQGDA